MCVPKLSGISLKTDSLYPSREQDTLFPAASFISCDIPGQDGKKENRKLKRVTSNAETTSTNYITYVRNGFYALEA